jgi:hypothetical protein
VQLLKRKEGELDPRQQELEGVAAEVAEGTLL